MSGSARSFSGIHKASISLSLALILFSLLALSVSPSMTLYASCYTYTPHSILLPPYFTNVPLEGFFLVYIPPEESVFTLLTVPSPLSCVFGVVASNQPLKFKVYGVHPTVSDVYYSPLRFDVLLDTEILSTTFVVTPIDESYYLLMVSWENQGDRPALLVFQSNVVFTLPQENPSTSLFRSMLIVGFIILAFAIAGVFSRLTQPSLTGVSDVLANTFKFTPAVLSYVMLPTSLLLLLYNLLPTASSLLTLLVAFHHASMPTASFFSLLALAAASFLAAFMMWVLALGFAVAFAYGVVYQGRPMLLGSLQLSIKRLFKLAATMLVVELVVYVGLLLLVIPGIFFYVIYALAPQAVVVEGAGVREALRRSKELVSESKLDTFIILLVLEAVSLTVVLVAYYASSAAALPLLTVLNLALTYVLPPLFLNPLLDFNLIAFTSPSILGACLLASFLLSIVLVIRSVGLTFWFYTLSCGVPGYTVQAFTCRFCGSALAERCKYCPYCGMKLEE